MARKGTRLIDLAPTQQCRGKRCYDKRGALTMRNSRQNRGVKLRVYNCPDCGMWHLTHKL